MKHSFRFALALGSFAASGCFVVEDKYLEQVEQAFEPDAGVFPVAESCAEAADPTNTNILTIAEQGIYDITTRDKAANFTPAACGYTANGPDVFVRVVASQGQFWHFHVAPTTGESVVLNPVVLMYPVGATNTCNTTVCDYSQDACDDSEEHFGIRFPSDGTWVLGIDNVGNEGGNYTLAVFTPTCGMFGQEHGEGCDDGNTTDGDGCDSACRVEISTDQTEPAGINDDEFWAQRIHLNAGNSNAVKINGTVLSQCDRDVFAVNVTAGSPVEVHAMLDDGTACRPITGLPYRLFVKPAGSTSSLPATSDPQGCARVLLTNPGQYFIHVEQPVGGTSLIPYVVRARVAP